MTYKEMHITCSARDKSENYQIFVREWGSAASPPILAIHGLGGQSVNFSPLAERLCDEYRVICVDMIGRGNSDWSRNPTQEYCFAYYCDVIEQILAALNVTSSFDWIGTSMGGALGMYTLGQPLGSRVNRLVVNDVGHRIDDTVLAAIESAVGNPPVFKTLDEATAYFKEFLGQMSCREATHDHWVKTAEAGCKPLSDGMLRLHYDPKIASQITYYPADYDNQGSFSAAAIPMLLIWGEQSTVLTSDIVQEMQHVKPDGLRVERYKGWGHAPFLDTEDDYKLIHQFLSGQ